ncbi:MAG: hypothetical protein JWM85_593 [Acidimicrobiaceae bacterium]|nr:hypothetical protein [Acidimicrobiaceae bacterium]
MAFAHDTEGALLTAAALVNTQANGGEALDSPSALNRFLAAHRYSGAGVTSSAEVEAVRRLRDRLLELWDVHDQRRAAVLVNAVLSQTTLQPCLTDHDGTGWHLHAVNAEAPVVQRVAAEAGLAFAELVRTASLDRLRRCHAPDCDAVLVDLSKNHSRRYCDTGNCGNRQHVAAYRARRQGKQPASEGS